MVVLLLVTQSLETSMETAITLGKCMGHAAIKIKQKLVFTKVLLAIGIYWLLHSTSSKLSRLSILQAIVALMEKVCVLYHCS